MIIRPRVQPVSVNARVPIGIRGQIHVAKLGRNGQRVPVRVDRNKRAWQRVWDHVQGNLITDGGLNYGLSGTTQPTSFSMELRFAQLTNWIHVGTGNAAPTTSDSALGTESARTNETMSLGTDGEVTLPSTGVGQFRRVRVFDYDEANGNLAEFGGGSDDSTTVLTRALFEDESEVPTPITKTSDELLIITYDLLSTVSPTSMTSDGTLLIDGYSTFDISSMAHEGAAGLTEQEFNHLGLWNSALRISPVTAVTTTYASNGGTKALGVPNQGLIGTEAYASGSFERIVTVDYGPQASGVTLAGYELTGAYAASGQRPLFTFRFDSPSGLVKDKDYRVTLSAKIAVARS